MSTLQGARVAKKAVMLAFAILACLVFSNTAQAGLVAPGDPLAGPDVFTVNSWTLVSSIQIRPITNGEPNFTLTSAVYNTGSVGCPGCLAFVYQIINSSSS